MKIYLVAAGGSGAKVAESLIHLCAAGLGPETVNILSVDTDDDNGNLARLIATHASYMGCKKYKWASEGKRNDIAPLPFGTEINMHKLSADSIVSEWGLENQKVCPSDRKDVLDLFFTKDEQSSRCTEGFLARPNLGSLIMGKHITDQLDIRDGEGAKFIDALRDDLGDESGARLVVVGSVFGGTGASVLPVAPDSIFKSLSANKNSGALNALKNSWGTLPKTAVMLMPYFQPVDAQDQDTETVDPSRFLADTKNALSYYDVSGTARKYEAVHLIGSDDPGRARLQFCTGSSRQRNAPSIEELAAALACLESESEGGPIRVFNPAENADRLRLKNFPWPRKEQDAINFSIFLHAACFCVRNRDVPMDRGIIQFVNQMADTGELPLWPWVAELLTTKDGNLMSYESKPALPELGAYFLRLLLWTRSITRSHEDLDLVLWKNGGDALDYWQALCVAKKDVTIPDPQEDSSPLAVTMTAACSAGIRTLSGKNSYRGPSLLNSAKKDADDWITNGTGPYTCILPFGDNDFAKAEQAAELRLENEYETSTGN